ncbi:MAG: M36 family metallopeptidase [Deltaproteobacteria bacterium]|nr:M36 family metallopeptidase [Deltaproteobacteria bacterium]
MSALAAAQPAAAQVQAVDALRKQIPELASDFDSVMGTTRSIYNRMGYLTDSISGSPMDVALGYVRANHGVLGLSAEDLGDFEVTDSVFSKVTGATHIYLRQRYDGIPVYNGQLHINVNRDGKIISVNNAFVRNIAQAINSTEPGIQPGDAVASLTQHLGLADSGLVATDAAAELFWLPIRDGDVRLVWNFQRETTDFDHHYDVTVDALSGEVMTRFDWTNSGTYRVYKEPDESPLHGTTARQLVVNPENGGASPNGWFTGGTMDGNNVHACPDTSPANNSCDSNPQCSGTTCDFAINLNQAPSNYVAAATANLFYWNNLIHDVQYQYGFDEPGGNFQENNFGLGGNGSDSVNADAQDGSGNCNANFSTPTDGGNPRMQMFTCTNASPARDGDLDNGVIVHEYGHGISIRQVGGPGNSSCLNNTQQGGEGWSDWFGLVYTAEVGDAGTDSRGIGTYLFGQAPNGPGIRDLPYSTNQAVNNWTYNSIGGAGIPHGVGSRWAQAAWEVYWALVDQHGFSAGDDLQDPVGDGWTGSQRALLYINEGLKNTQCSPTFINNRDGIIQAATDNFGGEDVCTLWEAFAAFGLGTNATTAGSGSRNATNGFDIPAACDCTPQPVANAGPNQTIAAGGSATIGTAAQAGHTYSWSPGGATTAQITVSPATTTTYTVTATTTCGSSSDSVTVTVAGPSGCPAGTTLLHEASFDSGSNGWTNDAASTCSTGTFVQGTPTVIVNGGVTTQVGGNASGAGSWFTATNSGAGTNDVDGGTCDTRSPGASAAAGNLNISFDYFHGQRDAGDDAADGFVVDVLSNGSVVATLVNIGDVTSNAAWTPFTGNVNLASAGNVQLRVRATDGSGPGDLVEGGIDNVQICGTEDDPPTGGCTVEDDFEGGAAAWTNDAASTCSTGAYVVGNPTQQTSSGVTTQVGGSNSGVNSIFTATNTTAGNADVDGGNCILGSPTWNVANASTLSVAYWHGQRDTGDDAAGDFFLLEYSTNGGSSWTTLRSNGDTRSSAAWATATTAIPAGSNVQLRVQCSDGAGPGDLVECGIDDVSICDN